MKKCYYSLLILTIFFLSCSNTGLNKEKNFSDIYLNCEVNTLLSIKFPREQLGDIGEISFYIENSSDYEFVFSYTENVKMWLFDSLEWLMVESDPRYFNAGADELYIDAYDFRGLLITPLANAGETIRIAVTGNFVINGVRDEKCIGAFADYTITP